MILPLLTAASFTPSIWVVTVVQVLGTGAPPRFCHPMLAAVCRSIMPGWKKDVEKGLQFEDV